jgi:GTP cyclohydrolase I
VRIGIRRKNNMPRNKKGSTAHSNALKSHQNKDDEVGTDKPVLGINDIKTTVRNLLLAIEGQPLRKQLLDTPKRVEKMISEIFDGYEVDIDSIFTTFDGEGRDQISIVKNIITWSVCEHHLLPFQLVVAVGYLPRERVIGASKLVRLVEAYSHRLQLQERITEQVANTLMEKLNPLGVGVIIEGEHLCMRIRGVKNTSSKLVTSVMLGEFRDSPTIRQEFLKMLD